MMEIDMQLIPVLPNGQSNYSMDGTIFDVQQGAALNLTGASDIVMLESGAGSVAVTGSNNTVTGSTVSGANVSLHGTGNTVYLGANAHVDDGAGSAAIDDAITVGANSTVNLNMSTNATVSAGDGSTINFTNNGGITYAPQSGTVNGNRSTINIAADWEAPTVHLNGSNNQLSMVGTTTLTVNGSGNTITGNHTGFWGGEVESITTATANLTQNADGTVALSGSASLSAVSLTNGVLTTTLDGNTINLTSVRAGQTIKYTDSSGVVTTSTMQDNDLQLMGGNLYRGIGNHISASYDNKIFDMQSQSSMDLVGSSNTIILETGAGTVSAGGDNNSVIGSGVSGANVNFRGTGNVATLGDHASVQDGYGGQANNSSITVGANSYCNLDWSFGATVNATQGGCTIDVGSNLISYGENATINANNDQIRMGGTLEANGSSAQVNGDNNQIGMARNSTLSLSGKNNTISIDANNANELITTSNGDYVQEDANGAIWFSSASFSIHDGVVTLGFSDGNKVVFSNVRSSSNPGVGAESSLNQLVAAMASYTTDGGASSVVMSHLPSDSSMLLASAHH
jgi:trimeric autotransporter adhesin